jgi:NTP pyrophosphatase (non-canonical NTP hydrolase)
MEAILDECMEAAEKYGSFASTHEAFGVLAEEVMELLHAIRKNNVEAIIHEATQVASVCIRLIEQCETHPAINADALKKGGMTFFHGRSSL